jgi:2-methylcitrate dehydratase PrpD
MPDTAFAERLATWALDFRASDTPDDLRNDARYRVLDVLGNIIAGSREPLGQAMLRAAPGFGAGDEARLLPSGMPVPGATAALVNGTLGHALDYDDTHNATLVHPSVPVVVTALALGPRVGLDGDDLLAAVVAGNEVFCRLGMVAPMAFHRNGLHPTSVLGPPVTALVAAKVLGLQAREAVNAVGISGSQASGILESFADGTWIKTMHPGWAAHGGVMAATLAAAGFTGPATVLEGRFGIFRSHVQGADEFDLDAMTRDLGRHWEARECSLKPYACAHVIHPYIDLALALHREGIRPEDVVRIRAPIQPRYIPVVGEPREIKIAPRTPTHARASLLYCIAAALHRGRLDLASFSPDAIAEPAILSLAAKSVVEEDRTETSPGQFRGELQVEMADGAILHRAQEHNRGSVAIPLAHEEIVGKFRENAKGSLTDRSAERVVETCMALGAGATAADLIETCIAGALDGAAAGPPTARSR